MDEARLNVWLFATALTAIAGQVAAAAHENVALSVTATAMFAVVAIYVAIRLNAKHEFKSVDSATMVRRAVTNAGLLASTFGWGGSAILAAYFLTDLFWHHAWQYGLAMLIIATGMVIYRRRLQHGEGRLVSRAELRATAILALIQAIAALAGLAFLFASGKLARHNADWIANHVFVAGGVVIVVVSALAYIGQRRPISS
ncbi:MAG: hypothetical protein ACR2OV_15245 [Hyphomicrobiaceae bacterium]